MKRWLPFVWLWVLGLFLTPPVDGRAHTSLLYGSYLGAEAAEYGRAIATDPAGNIYVTGETQSVIFPAADRNRTPHAPLHGIDVYVAKFNAASGAIDYTLWFNALTLFAEDYAYGLAVAPDGSAYVVGDTRSEDFCALFGTTPGFDPSYNGGGDAFILKIEPDGRSLAYCTFIGGSEADTARAIVLDAAGNAYVTGGTWSDADFPTTPDAYNTTHNGLRDAFLVKLSADGRQLLYATYLGGSGQDEGVAVALDNAGQAVAAGWTFSADFPTTPGAYDASHNGAADIFVATLNAAGSELVSATFLGGAQDDRPSGIGLDAAGAVYVGGYTASPAFPTTPGAFDRQHDGAVDGLVAKVAADGRTLHYSTFIGGAAEDWGSALAVAADGRVTLTGRTWSADFPLTAEPFSPALNGGRDGFIAQLDPTGGRLLYGSYLGGSDWDDALAVAQRDQTLYLTGNTRSADFPTTPHAHDASLNGDYDIFVLALSLPETAVAPLYLPLVSHAAPRQSDGYFEKTADFAD